MVGGEGAGRRPLRARLAMVLAGSSAVGRLRLFWKSKVILAFIKWRRLARDCAKPRRRRLYQSARAVASRQTPMFWLL
ncbi:unnamed protein product [Caenorhabditis auriculariae]|uniref:Uncharacterized protein n=1 Tax=Caenorhabditis auriculariae TaxID=2777116 RepID=A0A8S1HGA2_9PELO|nr:unnamed protein product [Caenorhabditis auriculariae]